MGSDLVPDYGTSSRITEIQAIVGKGLSRSRQIKPAVSPHYSVNDCVERTSLGHGLSEHELRRIANGLHFLKRYGEPCLWVVLGDGLLNLSEHEARAIVRAFTSQVAKVQKRAGLEQYWLRVHESSKGFHSNMVFPAPRGMDHDIRRWEQFGKYLREEDAVQPVYDFDGLTNYLAKERPPNVKGGWKFGRREKGSHKLGAGGGDRVQFSQALRADAVAAGVVEPWQRTKAKALVPSKPALIRPSIHVVVPAAAEIASTTNVEQLPLFETLPERPYLVPAEVRTFREETGCTQAEVSGGIGIKRSHVANYERGHDRLSPARQRALKHFMETRRLAA
jgi:DNA-binding transcriptional regulator YiaG